MLVASSSSSQPSSASAPTRGGWWPLAGLAGLAAGAESGVGAEGEATIGCAPEMRGDGAAVAAGGGGGGIEWRRGRSAGAPVGEPPAGCAPAPVIGGAGAGSLLYDSSLAFSDSISETKTFFCHSARSLRE